MRVGKRGRSSLVNATWFCACLGGIIGCKKATDHAVVVQIEHVGGAPYALRPVIPFVAEVADQGWWSATENRELSDTLWTDALGNVQVAMPPEGGALTGLLCEMHPDGESGAWYACKLQGAGCEEVVKCTLPGSVHIRFVGNRSGGMAHPGCWITEASAPATPTAGQWFTPGVAPTPSLVLGLWVHPDEPLPAQRTFRLVNAAGTTTALPAISIYSEQIGDTIVQPISF